MEKLRSKKWSRILIISVLMLAILATSVGVLAYNTAKSATDDFNHHFQKLKTAKTIYEVSGYLTGDEKWMISSLQGVLAQKESQIAIDLPSDFKKDIIEDYDRKVVPIDAWELVKKFKDEISGYVTYDYAPDGMESLYEHMATSTNKARTICGAEQCIMVRAGEEEAKLQKLGIKKKYDAVNDFDSELDVFEEFKDKLNKDYITIQSSSNSASTDIGIALRSPFQYVRTNNGKLDESDLQAQDTILQWMNAGGSALGWHADEVGGVARCSRYGIMTLPTDHAGNLTVYAGLESLPIEQKPYIVNEKYDTNKHYVTIQLTDGDNLQMHVNSYRQGKYAEKYRGDFPFGWSTAPSLFTLAPCIQRWYYKNNTFKDDFMAAVSGVGYVNPYELPKTQLKEYAKLTGRYMAANDIKTTALLMDSNENNLLNPNFNNNNEKGGNNLWTITEAFTAQPGIAGGFLYYGDKYRSTKAPGSVFWSNGKPFVTLRETMWGKTKIDVAKDSSGNEIASRDVTFEAIAHRINNYTKDATKVEGYTAICLAYWDYNLKDVDTLISMLDDDVVVVGPTEFIDIMTRNVKDKTTKLQLDDNISYNWQSVFGSTYQENNWMDKEEMLSQVPADKLSYDFNDGLQGWQPRVTDFGKKGEASLRVDGNKRVYYYNGLVANDAAADAKRSVPNTYLYNKVKLPDKADLKMEITGKWNDSAYRVEVMDETDKIESVKGFVVMNNPNEYQTVSVDMSKYKGKTVTVILEGRDNYGFKYENGEASTSRGTLKTGKISKIEFK